MKQKNIFKSKPHEGIFLCIIVCTEPGFFLCDIVCTLPGIGGGWAVGARVDPGPAVGGMMAGQSGRGQHGSSGLYFSLQVSGTWFKLGHLFNR